VKIPFDGHLDRDGLTGLYGRLEMIFLDGFYSGFIEAIGDRAEHS
jgi:hypothetical protein